MSVDRVRKLPDWLRNLGSQDNQDTTRVFKFSGSIECCSFVGECGEACEKILEENSHLDEIVLGFDMEWNVSYCSGESGRSRTSLIQICSSKHKCYLFRVNNIARLPLSFLHLLDHPQTKLVGVNIASDLWKLGKDFSITVQPLIEKKVIDIGRLANKVLQCEQNWSMAGLVTHLLNMKIDKSDTLRKSDWNSPSLTFDQQSYAATDAFAAFYLYFFLKERQKLSGNNDTSC